MSIETSNKKIITGLAGIIISFSLCSNVVKDVQAANANKPSARTQEIVKFWTPERRAQAIPRDLVIDERGLGYLRRPGGALAPYGHDIPAQQNASSGDITAFAGPSGGSDTTAPVIDNMVPGGGTIGASQTFSATVTDIGGSGVKSVKFYVQKSGGLAQNFTASGSAGSYSVNLSGFTDGSWSWWVVAKDNGAKGGNPATSPTVSFGVDTGSSGGGGGGSGSGTVTNAVWTAGGTVQQTAGRLYFQMPRNSAKTNWVGYVCSGTVANDGSTENGRSVIITASHCVYDDEHSAFARNVLFIPDQAGTTGSGTDLNCSNDPVGCWAPSFGVVDVNWTTRIFPDNIAWDYAYYVVNDSGAHTSSTTGLSGPYDLNPLTSVLDSVAGSLTIDFNPPNFDTSDNTDLTTALGYSYSDDPKFMYCQEDMVEESGGDDWWLASCGLSGGSSGGPWLQPISGGGGNIISVNSWGYTNQPGMAGPKLSGTSAQCVFGIAVSEAFFSDSDGNEGIAVTCPLI